MIWCDAELSRTYLAATLGWLTPARGFVADRRFSSLSVRSGRRALVERSAEDEEKRRMGPVENASEADELSRLRYDCLREFSSFIKSEGETFRVRPPFGSIGREVT